MQDINTFIRERSPRWRRLEQILDQVAAAGLQALSEAQAREFGALYRGTCSDLLQAQTEIRNAETVQYLNDLVARAYSILYAGQERKSLATVSGFYARDFPRLFRRTFAFFLVSLGLFAAGMCFGLLSGTRDPESLLYFLPPEMAEFKTADDYLSQKGSFAGASGAAAFTSMLFSNNLRVSFMAFASGLVIVGPVALIFYNGAMLGAFASLFHLWDRAFTFWSLIVPHGMLEMTACLISGQAGLLMASGILFPGEHTRLDSLRRRGADAVKLLLGSAPMTIFAAFLESYISPQSTRILPEAGKMLFALASALAVFAYLGWAGRGPGQPERERLRDLIMKTGSEG